MVKPIVKVHRYWQDKNQSLSTCLILNEENMPIFSSIILERGWRDNESNVSCIPSGMYELEFEESHRFKQKLWEVKGVEGRSECKFHSANFWKDLNGCLAPGRRPRDIDNDGYIDVTSSKDTLKDFHDVLKGHDKAVLIITTEPNIF